MMWSIANNARLRANVALKSARRWRARRCEEVNEEALHDDGHVHLVGRGNPADCAARRCDCSFDGGRQGVSDGSMPLTIAPFANQELRPL